MKQTIWRGMYLDIQTNKWIPIKKRKLKIKLPR